MSVLVGTLVLPRARQASLTVTIIGSASPTTGPTTWFMTDGRPDLTGRRCRVRWWRPVMPPPAYATSPAGGESSVHPAFVLIGRGRPSTATGQRDVARLRSRRRGRATPCCFVGSRRPAERFDVGFGLDAALPTTDWRTAGGYQVRAKPGRRP